jgi:hypothetical protein
MGVKIDATSLDKLQAQMKAGPPAVRSAYRKGLKSDGNIIRDDARARIADISPQTAANLKTFTSIPKATVTVQGGSKERVISKLLEGKDGKKGTWRHPLFGDREHWYPEVTHPHLWPAFQKHKKTAMKRVKRDVVAGLRAIDLKSEDA